MEVVCSMDTQTVDLRGRSKFYHLLTRALARVFKLYLDSICDLMSESEVNSEQRGLWERIFQKIFHTQSANLFNPPIKG